MPIAELRLKSLVATGSLRRLFGSIPWARSSGLDNPIITTSYRCAPPVRPGSGRLFANNRGLWAGLAPTIVLKHYEKLR